MDRNVWILIYGRIEKNEKKQTRIKKKQCLMVERNVRPKKPNGKENGESGTQSKGKGRDVRREKSQSKSHEQKLNKSRNVEARVVEKLKAKTKVVESCIVVSLKVERESKSCKELYHCIAVSLYRCIVVSL